MAEWSIVIGALIGSVAWLYCPPLLQRLGMDTEAFIACADTFFRSFANAVGTPASLAQLAARRQARALRGMATARQMLSPRPERVA